MITNRMRATLALASIAVAMLAGAAGARAATPPVKLVPVKQITGGLDSPESVAVGPTGNIYVTDRLNYRVQEFTAAGAFVLMFGKDVNQTTGGDVCTAASGNVCQVGVAGSGSGAFGEAQSVAVDQSTGNVYVQDLTNWRVQEFTAEGVFVLMFGMDVNETTGGGICTAVSGNVCKAGVESAPGSVEPGAFRFIQFYGNLLTVAEHRVYVGDEQRVQEFNPEGQFVGEIDLKSISSASGSFVTAVTVGGAGEVYLVYRVGGSTNTIRAFDSTGTEIRNAHFPLTLSPVQTGSELVINAIALDSAGHLAVIEEERGGGSRTPRGSLLEAATGHLITNFPTPGVFAPFNAAFNSANEMFVAGPTEIVVYKPVPVAELVTDASSCKEAAGVESSVTLDCTLNGEVNPYGVGQTEAWFEWGGTLAFGQRTPKQGVAPGSLAEPIEATIAGVKPNETLYDRVAGEDENVKAPELLTAEAAVFRTPVVPPRIVGEPRVEFVRSFSAVMFGEVNPENADTEYFFEYGEPGALEACPGGRKAQCPGVAFTPALESSVYGPVPATFEARGLQGGSSYAYRLRAADEAGEATGKQLTFSTAPAPKPEAFTGSANTITATGAVLTGTANPDGQPATYTFELGVYAGAVTQYGIVFSASAGSGRVPTQESLAVSGLQPATRYAYRIRVSSDYGTVWGEPAVFTTAGAPSVLAVPGVLAQLPVPSIAFPNVTVSKPALKKLARAQQLARALEACARKPKKLRAACRKQAQRKYAKSKQANRKKKG